MALSCFGRAQPTQLQSDLGQPVQPGGARITAARVNQAPVRFPFTMPAKLKNLFRKQDVGNPFAALAKEKLPNLTARLKDLPVGSWPSIDELCERLEMPTPEITDAADAAAVRASLMLIAGTVLSGTFTYRAQRSLPEAARAVFSSGGPAAVEAVQTVLKKGLLTANHKFEDGSTLLEDIVTSPADVRLPGVVPDADLAGVLLECGADPNQPLRDGAPPLAHVRTEQMHDALVRHGARVSIPSTNLAGSEIECSVLHLARSADTVKVHRAKGLQLDARDTDGKTPLHRAIEDGRSDVARELVVEGADVNAEAIGRWVPLHCGPTGDVVELLLDKGANPLVLATGNKWTALHAARDAKAVQLLVPFVGSNWTKTSTKAIEGQSVLDTAVARGSVGAVEELLRQDVNKEFDPAYALRLAKEPEIVGILFPRKGHSLSEAALEQVFEASREHGWSVDAYYFATKLDGDRDLIRRLIEANASAELKALLQRGFFDLGTGLDAEGLVPKSRAYSYAALLLTHFPQDFAVLRAQLEAGRLDVNADKLDGRSLLYLAARSSCSLDVVKYLVESGAAVNAAGGPNNRTPLHQAAIAGNLEVCRYLMAQGANSEAKDAEGNRPIDCAPWRLRAALNY